MLRCYAKLEEFFIDSKGCFPAKKSLPSNITFSVQDFTRAVKRRFFFRTVLVSIIISMLALAVLAAINPSDKSNLARFGVFGLCCVVSMFLLRWSNSYKFASLAVLITCLVELASAAFTSCGVFSLSFFMWPPLILFSHIFLGMRASGLTCTFGTGLCLFFYISFLLKGDAESSSAAATASTGLVTVVIIFTQWAIALLCWISNGLGKVAMDELKSTKETQTRFMTILVHEIRNPLTAILSTVELMQNHYSKPDIKTIRKSAELIMGIMNDIVEVAQMESGKLYIESVPFDVYELLEIQREMYKHLSDQKHVRVVSEVHPTIPQYLWGDPMRLSQTLGNFLSNAIKFSPEGAGDVTLSVNPTVDPIRLAQVATINNDTATGDDDNGHICLDFVVHDHGVGMTQGQMDDIFNLSAESKLVSHRKYGGTGLGLSVANRLCTLMNGKLFVQSELHAGSTFIFTVRLPLASADSYDPGPVPAADRYLRTMRRFELSVLGGESTLADEEDDDGDGESRPDIESDRKQSVDMSASGSNFPLSHHHKSAPSNSQPFPPQSLGVSQFHAHTKKPSFSSPVGTPPMSPSAHSSQSLLLNLAISSPEHSITIAPKDPGKHSPHGGRGGADDASIRTRPISNNSSGGQNQPPSMGPVMTLNFPQMSRAASSEPKASPRQTVSTIVSANNESTIPDPPISRSPLRRLRAGIVNAPPQNHQSLDLEVIDAKTKIRGPGAMSDAVADSAVAVAASTTVDPVPKTELPISAPGKSIAPGRKTTKKPRTSDNVGKKLADIINALPPILLVEDNEINQKLFRRMVEPYPLHIASDGREALEKVTQFSELTTNNAKQKVKVKDKERVPDDLGQDEHRVSASWKMKLRQLGANEQDSDHSEPAKPKQRSLILPAPIPRPLAPIRSNTGLGRLKHSGPPPVTLKFTKNFNDTNNNTSNNTNNTTSNNTNNNTNNNNNDGSVDLEGPVTTNNKGPNNNNNKPSQSKAKDKERPSDGLSIDAEKEVSISGRNSPLRKREQGSGTEDHNNCGYAIIFMDINMPVMDGIEATTEIRKAGFKSVPIIGLTANSFEKDRSMQAGMDQFLVKPCRRGVLLELIEQRYRALGVDPPPVPATPRPPQKTIKRRAMPSSHATTSEGAHKHAVSPLSVKRSLGSGGEVGLATTKSDAPSPPSTKRTLGTPSPHFRANARRPTLEGREESVGSELAKSALAIGPIGRGHILLDSTDGT